MSDNIPIADALKSTSLLALGTGMLGIGATMIALGGDLVRGVVLCGIGVTVLFVKYKTGY
jgi:hypothetical protein